MNTPLRLLGVGLCVFSMQPVPAPAQPQPPIRAQLVLTTGVFGSKFSGSNAANSDSTSMVTVPMLTMEGCRSEGERWMRRRSRFRKGFREYFCVAIR